MKHTDIYAHFPMSPAAVDVDLELRRLGGFSGVFNLLRRRAIAVGESDDVYAGRVELGAALLACRIGLGNPHTIRGAITTPSSYEVDGRDCQQRQQQQTQVDSSEVKALMATWGSNALAVVLDTLRGRPCFWGSHILSVIQSHVYVLCCPDAFASASVREGTIAAHNRTDQKL